MEAGARVAWVRLPGEHVAGVERRKRAEGTTEEPARGGVRERPFPRCGILSGGRPQDGWRVLAGGGEAGYGGGSRKAFAYLGRGVRGRRAGFG